MFTAFTVPRFWLIMGSVLLWIGLMWYLLQIRPRHKVRKQLRRDAKRAQERALNERLGSDQVIDAASYDPTQPADSRRTPRRKKRRGGKRPPNSPG
jgi:hypothetical protein